MNDILLEIDNFNTDELSELFQYVLSRLVSNNERGSDLIEFITHMVSHPELSSKMVEKGEFFRYNHEIRTCPNDGMNCGGCDNCYSGDTHFEHGLELQEAAQELFESMPVPDPSEDSSDAEDDGDSEYEPETITSPVVMRVTQKQVQDQFEASLVAADVPYSPFYLPGCMVASRPAQKGVAGSIVVNDNDKEEECGPLYDDTDDSRERLDAMGHEYNSVKTIKELQETGPQEPVKVYVLTVEYQSRKDCETRIEGVFRNKEDAIRVRDANFTLNYQEYQGWKIESGDGFRDDWKQFHRNDEYHIYTVTTKTLQ